jgi:phosphatidylglycerophosphatase A
MTYHTIAQDSLLLRDYQYVKQQDIWLSQPNLAALTRFATANIVEAEASLTKGNGDFVNYYESSNSLQGNIHMESLYRLNQRIVFFGAITFVNKAMRDTGTEDPGWIVIDEVCGIFMTFAFISPIWIKYLPFIILPLGFGLFRFFDILKRVCQFHRSSCLSVGGEDRGRDKREHHAEHQQKANQSLFHGKLIPPLVFVRSCSKVFPIGRVRFS